MPIEKDLKFPPSDTKAEESTLGALLMDGDKFDEITLSPNDFFIEINGIIYQAMKNLRLRGVGINEVTVAQELQSMGKLESVGGESKLPYLVSVCPTSLDIYWYADIVKRLSTYRKLINAGEKITTLGFEANGDLNVSLEKADELLLSIRKDSGDISILTPQDISDIALNHYNDLYNQEGEIPVTTGLRDLDKQLGGGFYKGEMVIMAGRPGIGKTELSLTMAVFAGINGNVLFCSAEMPIESIIDRYVAGILGVPLSDVRRGKYTEKFFVSLVGEPLQNIVDSNIYMYRDMPMTTSKILQAGMNMKLRHGLSLMIIDYLGILDDEYGANGYERVGYISRKTKQIARTLDIPVVAIHQLHREVEHRDDKRPQLSDLRDSGKLEEDADVVLLLYRDSYYSDEPEHQETEIIIAKHRQGVSNQVIGVYYDAKTRRYYDLKKEG